MKVINSLRLRKLLEAYTDVMTIFYLADLIQMSNQNIEGVGNAGTLASGTMIQPPSHTTIPAVASWFK